jgi:hypothetical protein
MSMYKLKLASLFSSPTLFRPVGPSKEKLSSLASLVPLVEWQTHTLFNIIENSFND